MNKEKENYENKLESSSNSYLDSEQTALQVQNTVAKEPYFGSVLFFKHVILGTIALMILIPVLISVILLMQNHRLKKQIAQTQQTLATVQIVGEQNTEVPTDAEQEETVVEAPASTMESRLENMDGPEYERLYPNFYAPDADYASVDKAKTVYLTFDDGPSARTPEILQILRRNNIKATFFVVGKSDEQSQEWMRQIVAEGHTLAMHSYTHEYTKVYASVESYLEDMNQLFELIRKATGQTPTVFRFPGGSINNFNRNIYTQLITEMIRRGFVYFDWNVQSGDAATKSPSEEQQIKNATARVNSDGRVFVLMHDSKGRKDTVSILQAVIDQYKTAGFEFDRLTPEVKPYVYTYLTNASAEE